MNLSYDGPTIPIFLPSKGILYNGLLPEGRVEIKPIDTIGEKVIVDSKTRADIQNEYLQRNMILPKGLTHLDLLTGDRLYAYFMIRAASYGPFYDVEFRCEVCQQKTKTAFDITELPVKYLPDDFFEPISTILPNKGDEIRFRLFRGHDEEALHAFLKGSVNNANTKQTSKMFELGRILDSINGAVIDRSTKEAKLLADAQVQAYLGKLLAWDSGHFQQAIEEVEPGLDLSVTAQCQNRMCRADNEFELSVEKEFFRPSRNKRS